LFTNCDNPHSTDAAKQVLLIKYNLEMNNNPLFTASSQAESKGTCIYIVYTISTFITL